MVGEDPLRLVHVVDDDLRPAQTAAHVDYVAAQADQVAVELEQAGVLVPEAPVDALLVGPA